MTARLAVRLIAVLAADAEVDADRWELATGRTLSPDQRDRFTEAIIVRRLAGFVASRHTLPVRS